MSLNFLEWSEDLFRVYPISPQLLATLSHLSGGDVLEFFCFVSLGPDLFFDSLGSILGVINIRNKNCNH